MLRKPRTFVLRFVAAAVLFGLIAIPVALIARPAATVAHAAVVGDQIASPAIGVNDYEVDGVEVALLSVKRISDGSLTVKWEYRNKTDEPKRLGESFTGMGSSEAYSLVWHAYLADARAKIKYPVAKDENSNPVGTKHGAGKVVILGPKKTMGTWAKFISVPATVKKISVFIPGTQPFEDVPITD
jgi:hypothetical protein